MRVGQKKVRNLIEKNMKSNIEDKEQQLALIYWAAVFISAIEVVLLCFNHA